MRRAAELDTTSLVDEDALDEGAVRAAAHEVGLSESAVDQAVREWRVGALTPLPALAQHRRLGLPAVTAAERLVPLPPAQAARALETWLHGQWFERRAIYGPETLWTPRRGPLASARRAVDLARDLRLRSAGQVRACVAPAADGSRVRLVADLGGTRSALLTGLVAGPAAVGGVVGAAAAALSGTPEVLLALPAAVGTGGAGWLGARHLLERRCTDVAHELELALDLLSGMPGRPRLHDRAAAWAAGRLPRGRR